MTAQPKDDQPGTDIRKVGRPRVGEGQVGRERIVEGTIEYVRAGNIEITRRGLATSMGITPALVTYYFPDPEELLREAVVGATQQWIERIARTASDPEFTPAERIERLQTLLCSMYAVDAALIAMRSRMHRQGLIETCVVAEGKRLMRPLLPGDPEVDGDRASFLISMLWGAASTCAEASTTYAFDGAELIAGRLSVRAR